MENKKIVWLLVLAVFAFFYLFNLSGWLMHDDEGTDFYEVWQYQAGKQPGEDFIAEQQPLYLISGGLLVDLFGRTALPLRLLSTIQVLVGVFVLTLVVDHIWGSRVAVLTAGFILTCGLVYEQARLFRPDPMMLAWEMLGLAAVLLAVNKQRRIFWSAAGASYGVAMLWKPFALFPLVGLAFYFLFWLWRARSSANKLEPVISGVYFGLPFLVVGGGINLLLHSQLGFYYGEVYSQHAQLGEGLGFLELVGRFLLFYFLLFWVNGIFLLVLPLWFVNRKNENQHRMETRLLLLQLVSPVVFVAISRPLYLRYYFYLVPVLAILLAWQLDLSLHNLVREKVVFRRFTPAVVLILFVTAVVFTRPNIPQLLSQKESDTIRLADYIAANTRPEDKVLSDYAGLNFFADRASIYEASIIAGGRIEGQIITGDLLIRRIEEDDVKMVLIHVEGGYPPPHQLVKLVDYTEFRAYINDRFVLSTTFDRAGQQIEVYTRQ